MEGQNFKKMNSIAQGEIFIVAYVNKQKVKHIGGKISTGTKGYGPGRMVNFATKAGVQIYF